MKRQDSKSKFVPNGSTVILVPKSKKHLLMIWEMMKLMTKIPKMTMNPQERLQQAISGAQKLMLNEEFNEKVERTAAKAAGRKYVPNVNVNNVQYQATQSMSDTIRSATHQITESQLSKLPAAIRESFANRPPVQTDNTDSGRITQALGNMIAQSQHSGIDYNYIKYLIDESIAKHIDSMKQSILNESALRAVKICNGNKIQVLDSKGSLYEGDLKLKKRKS